MKVCDLDFGGRHDLLESSPIWNRDVERIQPLDLHALVRAHWGLPTHSEVQRQVNDLIDSAWSASLQNDIGLPTLVRYEPVQARVTVDELLSWLREVSIARRRAILFGLETGLSCEQLISLTWADLRKMSLSQEALMLAQANPRHIRLDYVFWEPTPHMSAAPLLGLAHSMLDVSQGLGYEALRNLYKTMIPVDQEADRNAFFADLIEEHQSRTAYKN